MAKDERYGVMGYLLSNLDKKGGFDIERCEGSQLLAVRRGRDLCYVGADGAAGMNGAVVLLGNGSRLKNDVERCMANSGKYWICP